MEPTDAVLAARIAAGDVPAFETLVRRYRDGVFCLALRMVADRAEAEDIVQDVFVTAWRRIADLSDPAALRTWVFQIARRQCLILLRRRRMRRTVPVDAVPEGGATVGSARLVCDPQRVTEACAGMSALRRALGTLPRIQRDVWLLAEVGGLSSGEIGRRVGAGEEAVRGRLSRARANLADVLRAWR